MSINHLPHSQLYLRDWITKLQHPKFWDYSDPLQVCFVGHNNTKHDMTHKRNGCGFKVLARYVLQTTCSLTSFRETWGKKHIPASMVSTWLDSEELDKNKGVGLGSIWLWYRTFPMLELHITLPTLSHKIESTLLGFDSQNAGEQCEITLDIPHGNCIIYFLTKRVGYLLRFKSDCPHRSSFFTPECQDET